MLDRRRREDVQVSATARRHAIAFEPKSAGGVFGHEAEHGANFIWIGHVAGMADISRDFLLVVSAKGIVGVIDVVLACEKVDALAPKLLDAGYAAPDWLFVISALRD